MTVTKIEEISRARSRVLLEDFTELILYKGELRKYGIEAGKELEEDVLEELRTQVLPKRAKLRAMNLLKNREYTEKQLTDKLLLGGYDEETAREAVEYVKAFHYVDDDRYAYHYLACHMGRHSGKELEQKLLQRGIGRDRIRAALSKLEEDGVAADEEAVIRQLMKKKYNPDGKISDKEKQRIFAFFYRKGFSSEAIRKVCRDTFA